MRIISKRIGFKAQGANKIKKKQRLTGRIHNAGEYGLDAIYGETTFVLKLGLTDINDIKAYIQEVLNNQDLYKSLSGVSYDDFDSQYTDFMLDRLPQLTGQFTGDTFYFNFSSEHELSYNKETGIVTMCYNS